MGGDNQRGMPLMELVFPTPTTFKELVFLEKKVFENILTKCGKI